MFAQRQVSIGKHAAVLIGVVFCVGTVVDSGTSWRPDPDRPGHRVAGFVDRADAANAWETGEYREITPHIGSSASSTRTRSLTPTVKLSHTVVQRPKMNPGEEAALRAEYEVAAPDGLLQVREIRIIRFEGQQVARVERLVARSTGTAASDYYLKVPLDAAPGWYTVTTIVGANVSTRAVKEEQKATAAFYIESGSTPSGSTLSASAPPSSVSHPTDDRITMKLWAEKPRYKIGEAVKVFFESNKDAYVTLVNVGTSGRITILYPNKFSPSSEVKAGRTYSVPGAGDQYQLTISGPSGVELVYALVTATPTRFVEANFTEGPPFPAVNDRADLLTRDINVAVKKIPLKEQASAAVEIEVTP